MKTDKVKACVLKSLDTSTLTGIYLPVNPLGLDGACFSLRIINNSNKDLTISYDGVTDHDFLPAGDYMHYDFQLNWMPGNMLALMAKGTKIYVKATAGTGYVYVTGYYVE